MELMLKLVSPTGIEINKIFLNENSATLGRNEDNTLVLQDPKKYISGHHAVIDFRSPDYFITDTSTNGVFINDTTQPVGNGNSVKLKTGDQLNIGDYSVHATIVDEQAQTLDIPSGPLLANQAIDFADDPFAELDADPVQDMIDENQLIPSDWKEEGSDNDPFNIPVSDQFDSFSKVEDGDNESEIEQPSAFNEAFQPFKSEKKEQESVAEDSINVNWFDESQEKKNSPSEELFPEDFFSEKKTSIESPPESKPADQQSDEAVNQIEKAEESQKITKTTDLNAIIVDNFLRGAGLENSGINDSLTPETFFIIGRILRASVQGTMETLIGRAKIKNEMHLDTTMIRSGQNNPIKFSVSTEEAIKKLLSPQDAGYLSAEEAINEAFNDICAHQFSVIAGMQTALLEVLKQFDPDKLEHQLQEQNPISANIPIHKQAKLWRLFELLYDDIQREAADNFYHLFGQAFAETYEQQIIKLKKINKESPF